MAAVHYTFRDNEHVLVVGCAILAASTLISLSGMEPYFEGRFIKE